MKRLSNIFSQGHVNPIIINGNRFVDGYEMQAYVESSTGQNNDTSEDRLLKIFTYFRENDVQSDWYRIPGIRAFFDKYILSCPFIPNDLKEAEVISRAIAPNPKGFLGEWADRFGPIESFEIDPNALLETIDILPDVKKDFLEKNLHSIAYFYSKYTEWHITRCYQENMKAKHVVDIGAAYNGFARTLAAFDSEVEILMVDLGFPQGLKGILPQISTLGTDAADMSPIDNGTIDLVCMHNAFEHFAGDSDINCLKEVSRILRPGGIALITPFFFAQKHSVTLSPAPSFLFDRTSTFTDIARKELKETGGRLDFNTRIVSPFARRYDMQTTLSRIIKSAPDLDVVLKGCKFSRNDSEIRYSLENLPDMEIDPRLYELTHFNYLEFTKS